MRVLQEKFTEVFWSIMPIVFIILVLHFTFVPLPMPLLFRFLGGSLLIMTGLSLFLFGVDRAVTPLGNHMGERIVKVNKLWLIVVAAFVLGFVISVAEPGLLVYTQQVEGLTEGVIGSGMLLLIVSLGIALLLILGFLRIIYNWPLYRLLVILYGMIFVLSWFSAPQFLIIAFDASGATTGVLSVPFILSLAYGISHLKRDSKAGEADAFGTIAIVSAGAILSVILVSLMMPHLTFTIADAPAAPRDFLSIGRALLASLKDTLFALAPIILILGLAQFSQLRMRFRRFVHVFKGMVYILIGLVLFLMGVNIGFMDVGRLIGQTLAQMDSYVWLLIMAFILGVVTILAEPAVHVLTHQIEDVTSGYVSKRLVMMMLSIGVGAAVTLSAVRVFIDGMQVWHILLPGYILAFGLARFVPKIFVGMAFDAGGVATGPMIAAFILAFMQGATDSVAGTDSILDGLGTIAVVAMTPIITLLLLGALYKSKQKGAVNDAHKHD